MSVLFIGPSDIEVWNPATATARVFLQQADALSNMVGVATGFGPLRSDEVQIELPQFAKFAQSVCERISTLQDGSALELMLVGVGGIVLALAERLGVRVLTGNRGVSLALASGRRALG